MLEGVTRSRGPWLVSGLVAVAAGAGIGLAAGGGNDSPARPPAPAARTFHPAVPRTPAVPVLRAGTTPAPVAPASGTPGPASPSEPQTRDYEAGAG